MGNFPIGNRDASGQFRLPADGWYHLSPKGEFPHTSSGLMQVVDDTALAAMVNRFTQESAAPNFPGLLVDFDHFSYDTEKSSEAAGWITALENRDDGLWAQIRWSDQGQNALEKGRYRLISPVWLPKDVAGLGQNRIRPLRLDTAGLTNNPNLKGMVPLSNRREAGIFPAHTHRQAGMPASQDFAAAGATADSQPQIKKQRMNTIATKLGLSAEASEETILAEVTKLQNRAEAAEAALAPITNRAAEASNKVLALEKANQELLAAQVETDLDKFANRFKPEARDKWKAQLLANRAATLELLATLPEPTSAATAAAIHNRAAAQTPPGQGGSEPAKTFPDLVKAEMAGGKTKVQAISAIMNREPAIYSDWLAKGGQAHI